MSCIFAGDLEIDFWGVSLDVPEDFISPDWDKVLRGSLQWDSEQKDFVRCGPSLYEVYVGKARESGQEYILEPQPFITEFCKALEKTGMREGRDADTWFDRLIAHFGMPFLLDSIEEMRKVYDKEPDSEEEEGIGQADGGFAEADRSSEG